MEASRLARAFGDWLTRVIVGGLGVVLLVLASHRGVASGVVGQCTEADLRAALEGGGVVTFACDGTIVLSDTLVIGSNTLLDASGRSVSLSGNNAVRIIQIGSGVTLTLVNLTLADGTVRGTNGNPGIAGGPAGGGAIYNDGGILLASDCTFLRNKVLGGAGGLATSVFPQVTGNGGPGYGGALFNTNGGQITATNCVFLLNAALGGDGRGVSSQSARGGEGAGGVLYNADGNVFLTRCQISTNSAASGSSQRLGGYSVTLARGGAICNINGQLNLSRLELAANSVTVGLLSAAHGGAIHHDGGLLTLTECYLHDNRAQGGSGVSVGSPSGFPGGPSAGGSISIRSGTAEITGTTVANNLAVGGKTGSDSGAGTGRGGGIFNAGLLKVENTTITRNTAVAGDTGSYGRRGSGSGYGGGLYNDAGVVTLVHATLADNVAHTTEPGVFYGVEQGGGIFSTNGSVTLSNSIVARNSAGGNCFATLVDGGHNVSSDASCPFSAPGSLINTDPRLGPFTDYGGPTPTLALLAGSPAIDAASPESCPATDQRGRARPSGASCDIGAFESSPPYTVAGRVSGFLPSATPIVVSSGPNGAPVDAAGVYAAQGFTAGPYLLTPVSPLCVFVLSNRVVNVGPDVAGVDFYSYRSNALVLERIAGPVARGVFAGEAGQTYRVLISSDLSEWNPWSTNTVAADGLFEFFDDTAAFQPRRYFQVVRP